MTNKFNTLGRISSTKVAVLSDVHELNEGNPVELWVLENARAVVRCMNECGNNYTDLDLFELLEWAKSNGIDDRTKKTVAARTFIGGN